ncbi:hypothetical protein F5B19DRAFT_463737 [Rostrohypoxylon terebratum]|nr:hypothetical protein F5B19DRAFT_463737 [Rostrohypoxylon terebratum]
MSAMRLRPFPPQLLRLFQHHGHQQMRLVYRCSVRPTLDRLTRFDPNACSFSSVTQFAEEKAATPDISLEEKTEEHLSVPTTIGNNPTTQAETKEPEKTVAILWDLDNKAPKTLPQNIALVIRSLASERGKIIDYTAMANFHTYITVKATHKNVIAAQAREKRGRSYKKSSGPVNCSVCGKQVRTEVKLQNHYKEHKRELRKKENRLRATKKSKRGKWLALHGKSLQRLREASASMRPKKAPTLLRSLRRVGVSIQMVKSTHNAADMALRLRYSRLAKNSGLTLIIISDDSDFKNMARAARKRHNVHVVVVGDQQGKLAKVASEWWSWHDIHATATSDGFDVQEALASLPEVNLEGPDYIIEPRLKKELIAEAIARCETIEDEVEVEFELCR